MHVAEIGSIGATEATGTPGPGFRCSTNTIVDVVHMIVEPRLRKLA